MAAKRRPLIDRAGITLGVAEPGAATKIADARMSRSR
jgi:hypothetical protein